MVKIAEDSDFDMLKLLVDDHTNWKLDYDQGGAKVSFLCDSFFFLFGGRVDVAVSQWAPIVEVR